MKNKNTFAALFFGCTLIISTVSCGNAGVKEKENTTNISKDSIKKLAADSIMNSRVEAPPVHPLYNDLARYIAGMQITNSSSIDASLTNDPKWKEYASDFDKSWGTLDTSKIAKMKTWRNNELKEADSKTIFYPFSGADFFNVYTLFPNADNYIMVGLEPVGTPPYFHKGMSKDSISQYFQKVHTSLYSILNFSFFRTRSMSVDFNAKDLNGTIHIILLFIERTGNSIVDVKPAGIDNTGKIITYKSFKEPKQAGDVNRGIEIDFYGSDKVLRKAYYFSVNLDNEHLPKNPDFIKMVNSYNSSMTTYVKSASYLMHKEYFSTIRDLITTNSQSVLQDDSGIPYKYFDSKVWKPTLYGTYTGSIPLFTHVFQKDLSDGFKDKNINKPLPFGIGYKYKVGDSNLMYFRKK